MSLIPSPAASLPTTHRVGTPAWILIASWVILLGWSCGPPPSDPSEGVDEPAAIVQTEAQATELEIYDGIGGDFSLTDQQGRPFRLADSQGRIRLLFFGFTMCPDVCPMTLSKVVQIRQMLGEDAERLLPLFVSVDPERDTPEKLRAYLKFFDLGESHALTGTPGEVQKVLDLFKASAEKGEPNASGQYQVNHTSYLFLIDPEGRTRGIFGVSEKIGTIVSAVRMLLSE